MSRRIEMTPLRAAARWMGLLALWCALSGCAGGSGSSGFDPVAAENSAIQKALDSNGCEVVEGLTICAAGGESPTPVSTATAQPVESSPTTTPALTPTAGAVTPTTTPPPPTTAPSVTTPAGFTMTPTLSSGTATPTSSPGVAGTATPTGTPPQISTPTSTGTLPPATQTQTASPIQTQQARPTRTAVPTNSVSPTPTATPIPSRPSIETNIAPSDMVDCQPVGAASACTFVFSFRPIGLPASASYRVALRSRNPDSQWQIFAAPGNSVALPLDTSDPNTEYQIAVLAFLQDPGALPERVEILGDTGADFAFVTPLLRPEPI